MKSATKTTIKEYIKKSDTNAPQILREKTSTKASNKRDDSFIAKLGLSFIKRYKKDLQALARK
jgi:hypothetical protein